MTGQPYLQSGAAGTIDAVVAQILAGRPDTLYEQAAGFDTANRTLQDLATGFTAQLRRIDEYWQPRTRSEPLAASRVAMVTLLQQLQCPEYGPLLRRAGAALTAAQSRIRELQMRRAAALPGQYEHEAVAIRRDLAQHLSEVGETLPALPERTVAGTVIPVHTTPAPRDDAGATASAASGGPPTPPHPAPSVPAGLGSTSTQAVVLAAIGRPGALHPGTVSLAAAGPDDPPLGAAAGSVTGIEADLRSLPGANKDAPNQGGPPPAAGGSPMTPFMMPMGMGMGMGMSAGGDVGGRSRTASGSADVAAWDDDPKPGGGDGVLGRTPKPPPLDEKELFQPLPGGSYG
jgi:hypothetical protein